QLWRHAAFSTELLAESYARQADADLPAARDAAAQSVSRAPDFAFALIRQAELEFGFGHARRSHDLLRRGLELAPDHAAAHGLRGFLLAAEYRIDAARQAFERALALDHDLGNAWLGRGLCRIRQGDLEGGRADLIAAAAAESQRSILRSYLAKSFADS